MYIKRRLLQGSLNCTHGRYCFWGCTPARLKERVRYVSAGSKGLDLLSQPLGAVDADPGSLMQVRSSSAFYPLITFANEYMHYWRLATQEHNGLRS